MWHLDDNQRRDKMRSVRAVNNQVVPDIYYKYPTHLVAGKDDVVEAQQLGEHVVLPSEREEQRRRQIFKIER